MTTDIFSERLQQYEAANSIQWHNGQRTTFLNDLKKEVQFTGGGFRTHRGARITNIDDYVSAMLERGSYTVVKPSTKLKYQPVFSIRDEGSKKTHKKISEQTLKKALAIEGIVFLPGMESKAVELIASNFLPVDDPAKGTIFHLISDTEVGSFPSQQGYSVSELVNGLVSAWVDGEASKIAQLSHRAALRQQATTMVKPGSKPDEIERLTDELAAFEKRSLKTGKVFPQISRAHIADEFVKFNSLNGVDTNNAKFQAKRQIEALDNVQPIQFEASQIEIPSNSEPHKF